MAGIVNMTQILTDTNPYLHASLVLGAVQQVDLDRNGLGPLGALLGGLGGLAGCLVRAVVQVPVVLRTLRTVVERN